MPKNYTLYVDGGGGSSVNTPTYFSYFCPQHKKIKMERFLLANLAPDLLPKGCSIFNIKGKETNNIAEYAALYYGLQRFREYLDWVPVTIYHDSEIVVRQVSKRLDLWENDYYDCKQHHLIPWLNAIEDIWYPRITYKWITRNKIIKVLGH